MKNFTRILIASSLILMTAFNSYSQDLFKTGNVGIGTTSPTQKLDVFGSVKFSGALMPNNNAGLTGNILLSNGPGNFPTWLSNGTSGQILVVSTSSVPSWVSISTALGNPWTLTGNNISPFTYGTYFIGTTNTSGNEPLEFYVNNAYAGVIDPTNSNVYLGGGAGNDAAAIIASASDNVGIGYGSLASVIASTSDNTAIGYYALYSYKSGGSTTSNTGVGAYALYSNTTGSPNDAFGYAASYSMTTGAQNVAIGYLSNYWNQTGSDNLAVGDSAMFGATNPGTAGAIYTVAGDNTAVGVSALAGIATIGGVTANNNTAVGYEASRHLTNGNYNTSLGYQANYTNQTGYGNVAAGYDALFTNTYSGNTAIGTNALYNNNIGGVANGPNVAVGDSAMYKNFKGVQDVAVGYGALTAAGTSGNANNDNTAVGYLAMSAASGASANNVNIGAMTDFSYTQENNDVAVGAFALYNGTAAANPSQDIAIGAYALYAAGTGANYDIAIGSGNSTTTGTLGSTSFTGQGDIAIGFEAGNYTTSPGVAITTGSYDVLLGYEAYATVATVSQSIAIGFNAHYGGTGSTTANNTAIGYNSAATGASNSTAIGEGTTASGTSATAIGAGTNATNTSSTAIGSGANASASNATAIGPSSTANTANTVILGSGANVGIGTTAPARELEVAGAANTVRIDGLASGGTFNAQLSGTGNIVYSNNSNGDLYSLPNGTVGEVLTLSGNIPSWAVSSALPTATSPLSVTGSNIALVGNTGTVLVGTGTGSEFFGAGPVNEVLVAQGAGNLPTWSAVSAIAGSGDNWGTQVAVTDSSNETIPGTPENTITGDGLSSSPLRLSRQGASNNQVLLWNTASNTWKPGTGNSSLTTNSILGGTAVVITNGANQVVGSSNVTVDVQGTAGAVLYGKGIGSSAIFSAAGSTGQVLISGGAGAPTWTTLTTTGAWNTSGNSGTTPGTNFIGTTTDEGFDLEVNNANAGAIDPLNAGSSAANVYLGAASSSPTLNGAGNNDAGDNNVAIGLSALSSAGGPSYVGNPAAAATGYITGNVAAGVYALALAKYGGDNTAIGAYSQFNANWSSETNSGGIPALGGTINGNNTSAGAYSLYSNSTGQNNTSMGYYSMYGSGSATAVGNYNVAEGYKALYTAGPGIASNTAVGSNSLYSGAGSRNTAVGDSALYSNSGSNNTALGYQATATGAISNATAIGAFAVAAQSNTIVLGQISSVGNGTINTNVGIGTNTPDADAALAIKTLHIETQAAASNLIISTSNGASAATLTGTDVGGVISFTVPSSGGTSGAQVSVVFANAYKVAPTIIITAANSVAGTVMGSCLPYVSNVSTTGFSINFTNAASAGSSGAVQFYYFVIETQ